MCWPTPYEKEVSKNKSFYIGSKKKKIKTITKIPGTSSIFMKTQNSIIARKFSTVNVMNMNTAHVLENETPNFIENSEFLNYLYNKKNNEARNLACSINVGPQHPSAHGVLRVVVHVQGERIVGAIIHIGLLHRGSEKLIETKPYLKGLPYFDRLDYVSMMANEHAYSLAVEQCHNMQISVQESAARVLMSEVTRILNHIMAITTHAMDVGALTPFLHGFEEREKLFRIYEEISGARMHAAAIRPGFKYSIWDKLNTVILKELTETIEGFADRINECEELLTNNRIWKGRLQGVGVLSDTMVEELGLTGVLARSSGCYFDLRKTNHAEIYNKVNFKVPVTNNGDCFARYLNRVAEMRESISIIQQILEQLSCKSLLHTPFENNILPASRKNMENLIEHFKQFENGISQNGYDEVYVSVEAPKGEFGVYLSFDKNNQIVPERCKIKAPGTLHINALATMTKNHLIADLVTIIGTLDIVFGEVDR